MSENLNVENTVVEDADTILPDGWTDGADFFNPETWGSTGTAAKEDDFFADVLDEPVEGSEVTEEQTGTEPTTATETGDANFGEPTTAEETTPPTTEVEAPVAEPNKLRFTARVDHEDTDVELDESELPTVWQKATATDRYQRKLAEVNPIMERLERMAKANGYDTAVAMLDAQEAYDRDNAIEQLMKEGTPRAIAEDYVSRKFGNPSPAQTPEKAAETVEAKAETQPNNPPARDFTAEVNELWTMRPDLKGKTLPSEVARAAVNGQNLTLAYFAYEAKQAQETAEQLRQENNTYRQNAATAAKAPVKGVSGGGATDTKPADPGLAGFDSTW